jgi:hypothetical protein
MLKKTLIAISLMSPLLAISATAHAGSTITDKSYWPSAARQSAQAPHSGLDSALAYDQPASSLQPATNTNNGGSAWRYQGGPHPR